MPSQEHRHHSDWTVLVWIFIHYPRYREMILMIVKHNSKGNVVNVVWNQTGGVISLNEEKERTQSRILMSQFNSSTLTQDSFIYLQSVNVKSSLKDIYYQWNCTELRNDPQSVTQFLVKSLYSLVSIPTREDTSVKYHSQDNTRSLIVGPKSVEEINSVGQHTKKRLYQCRTEKQE